MRPKPPRQHYISKFLIKQWADDAGDVGVVCLHHRDSAVVSPSGLHYVRSLSSPEQESDWSGEESRANDVLDGLTRLLGPDGDDWADAETLLSAPANVQALISLVRLHQARSLEVPLQQLFGPNGTADSAKSEAKIRARWNDAQGYYSCGIEVAVFPADVPVALGAIPVFDAQNWGGRLPGTARFMMPLTPHVVISGTPERPPGPAQVGSARIDDADPLRWQLAGAPGQFSTPYLICEPSTLERTASAALAWTAGGTMHWYALSNRIDLCGNRASSDLRADWRRRFQRYERNQSLYGEPSTTDTVKDEIQRTMAEDAHKIQEDLDMLGVSVCACKQHRQNPEISALWESFMPQVLCDEIRRKRKVG